ncbi:hypothetical protein AAMO2058_000595200 [Amorphochlora amoebiformis]
MEDIPRLDGKAAAAIAADLKGRYSKPISVALICGSGLSEINEVLEDSLTIEYTHITGWPRTTVEGHPGKLVFGSLGNKNVVCMCGRFHTYEGYNIQKTSLPIIVFKFLGAKMLIVTNASGALNSTYNVGDIMIISDHVNLPGFAGKHPLVGKNDEQLGLRFPSMSDCYSTPLINYATKVGLKLGLDSIMHSGTYCFVGGPSYETAAEALFLRNAGGDAVGMSTVPETIVAKYLGLQVLGLSLIANKVITDRNSEDVANHKEVIQNSKLSKNIQNIVQGVIAGYDPSKADAKSARTCER